MLLHFHPLLCRVVGSNRLVVFAFASASAPSSRAMPKRILQKSSRRKLRSLASNRRSAARRAAIDILNGLLDGLGFPLPALRAKTLDAAAFAKVLRTLSKRCLDQPALGRFAEALRKFTSNGAAGNDGFTKCFGVIIPRNKIIVEYIHLF